MDIAGAYPLQEACETYNMTLTMDSLQEFRLMRIPSPEIFEKNEMNIYHHFYENMFFGELCTL